MAASNNTTKLSDLNASKKPSKFEQVSAYNAPAGSVINAAVVDAILSKNFDKGDPNIVTGEELKSAEKKGQIDPSLGNLFSSNAAVAKGAAALGVTKVVNANNYLAGGKPTIGYGGDLIAAAKAIGIDPANFTKVTTGAMGTKQTIIDKGALYNAINTKANEAGLYAITERDPGTTGSGYNAVHATTLYTNKDGVLQPMVGSDGKPVTSTFKANTFVSDPGILGGLIEGVAGIADALSPILIAAGVANGLNFILNGISNAGVAASTLDAAGSAATTAIQNAGIGGNYLTSGLALPGGATTAGTAALNAGGGVLAPGLGASVGAGGTAIGAGSVGLSSLIPSGLTAGAANLLPTAINAADLLGPNIGAGLSTGLSLSDLSNLPTGVTDVISSKDIGSQDFPVTVSPSDIPGATVPAIDTGIDLGDIISGTDLGSQTFPVTVDPSDVAGATIPAIDTGDLGDIVSGNDLGNQDFPINVDDNSGIDLGDIADGAVKYTGLTADQIKKLLSDALGKSSLASLLTGAGQGAASIYAANKQYEAAKYAADQQRKMFDIINEQYAPQRGAGYQALNQIRGMLPGEYKQYGETGKGIGTATGTDYLTRQFTPQDLYAGLAPNYNFMLQQGQQAAQRQANIGGGGMGGNAQRALQQYTQDYAGNAYQNAFQNFQNQRSNIYNTLAGIAGLGQAAQGTTAQAGQNMATNVGQLAVGGAGAQAAGITGAANAIAGGIQNYNANQILQAILAQNQDVAKNNSIATPPFNPA
jgi:hypothetical protein